MKYSAVKYSTSMHCIALHYTSLHCTASVGGLCVIVLLAAKLATQVKVDTGRGSGGEDMNGFTFNVFFLQCEGNF